MTDLRGEDDGGRILRSDRRVAVAEAVCRRGPLLRLGSVDVEREVLVVDLLVRPVGTDFLDRRVERRLQRRVFLAQADAGAVAEDRAAQLGPDELEILTLGLVEEPFLEHDRIGEDEIEPSRGEVEVDVVLGVVFLDVDDLAVGLVDIVGVDRRALNADRLALQPGLADLDARALLADEAGRRLVVLAGEVDALLALLGDRHAGDDGIVFLGQEARNDPVPILRHDLAIELGLDAQRLGDVDIEALELAARILEVERRIGALGRDLDLCLRRCRPGECQAAGQRRNEEESEFRLHEARSLGLLLSATVAR